MHCQNWGTIVDYGLLLTVARSAIPPLVCRMSRNMKEARKVSSANSEDNLLRFKQEDGAVTKVEIDKVLCLCV